MERKNNDALTNARLTDVDCRVDALGMARWVEEVLKQHADSFCCADYQSVFRAMDIEGKDVLIGGAGRLLGMRILVSRSGILGRIDVCGEPVETLSETPDTPFSSIPFARVFALSNRLRERIGQMLPPAFRLVPFLGGVNSIILGDEPQVIVDYCLPQIELFGKDGRFRLFQAGGISQELALPEEVRYESRAPRRITSKLEFPGKEQYLLRMADVLEKLKSDLVQKVVVARKCTVTTAEPFDRLDYAAYLLERYFQEYFYLFRQGGRAYWMGISPEIIMKQQGRTAVTKPLAGTRKKTEDAAENERVRKELTSTNKDIVEHEHALHFMVAQLEGADIGDVRIDKNKTVLETPYAFHIKSEISIQTKEGVSCFDIIGAIYPPATIWGIPVDATEHILAQTEPFEREQFTGVYGYWNFEGEADTALVIRTAKVDGDSISAYAGGGIVKYSDPDAEFDETVNKMRPLLSYFTEG